MMINSVTLYVTYPSSISVCGLPMSPVPLSSLWTPVLEERGERETWERTRWTWETRTSHQADHRPLPRHHLYQVTQYIYREINCPKNIC